MTWKAPRPADISLHDWLAEAGVLGSPTAPPIPGRLAMPAPRISRLRKRHTRCHELSALGANTALANGEEWEVVSGLVELHPGRPMVHSWLRRDGVVYEPVLDYVYVSEANYASRVNAIEVVALPASEVANLLVRDRHTGPWWPKLQDEQLPSPMRPGQPFRDELLFESGLVGTPREAI